MRNRTFFFTFILLIGFLFLLDSAIAQESACNNGVSDDTDSLIDCADPDCVQRFDNFGNQVDLEGNPDTNSTNDFCESVEFSCSDGNDNDGDGLVDTADPECSDTDPVIVTDSFSVRAVPETLRTVMSPTTGGCAGFAAEFFATARFTNNSTDSTFSDLVIRVAELSGGREIDNSLDEDLRTEGALLAVSETGDYSDGRLSPGEQADVDFVICLPTITSFVIFLDVLGRPFVQPPIASCISPDFLNLQGLIVQFEDDSNNICALTGNGDGTQDSTSFVTIICDHNIQDQEFIGRDLALFGPPASRTLVDFTTISLTGSPEGLFMPFSGRATLENNMQTLRVEAAFANFQEADGTIISTSSNEFDFTGNCINVGQRVEESENN